MLLGEVLGFWFLVGLAFFGYRRLTNGKPSQNPRVVPSSNGQRK